MLTELEAIADEEALREYVCKVVSYFERHLLMTVRIHHHKINGSTHYLTFSMVYYFDGPLMWTGANFRQLSLQDAEAIWRRTDQADTYGRTMQVAQIFPVYAVKTLNYSVTIACGGISISKAAPSHTNSNEA